MLRLVALHPLALPHPSLLLILYRPNGVKCPAESNPHVRRAGQCHGGLSCTCPAESNCHRKARRTVPRTAVLQVSCGAELP